MDSRFTGGTFKLLLLLAALYLGTIFSLGIAYPWLACLVYRWEIKNTVINGKKQYFDGKGADLFKNYIKWLLLTIVTLSVYKLWLSRNVMVWKVSHTHFEGEDKKISCYSCRISEKVIMLIKYYALKIGTLTLGSSWADCYKMRWTLEHTAIDGQRLTYNAKGLDYLGKLALTVMLIIVTAGIFILWTPVFLKKYEVKHTALSIA
ncbi:MAG: DUF898 domain-containing protein [Clostridia bacterium]|nr:DUF898 domain-containing protein [Clostridia bacterium]